MSVLDLLIAHLKTFAVVGGAGPSWRGPSVSPCIYSSGSDTLKGVIDDAIKRVRKGVRNDDEATNWD